ncbi:MAG: hypothetical protein FJ104_01185 [Deltaproteobacteria bacterium]|nr:hypothetical protein [Deltaproteobacteria bacterium]
MDGAETIPPPREDDDLDVAWALQTAAVQWNRGARADAVVWIRRAVDAAINVGDARRTQELTALASQVAERLVTEVVRVASQAPPLRRSVADDEVDSLLSSPPPAPAAASRRGTAPSLTGEIPVDFDDGEVEELDADDLIDDAEPADAEPADDRPADDRPADDHEADDDPGTPPPAPRSVAAPVEALAAEEASPAGAVGEEASLDGKVGEEASLDGAAAEEASLDGAAAEGSLPGEPPAGETAAGEPPLEDEAPPGGPVGGDAPTSIVDGCDLASLRGFEDLPEEAQQALAAGASVAELGAEEEVSGFAAAVVTAGSVGLMPAVADVAVAVVDAGGVLFTGGTLAERVSLRIVALADGARVVTIPTELLDAALADCPWVGDELRAIGDRFQALAGAVLGPLGDRLDDQLRELVFSRMEVKAFGAHETIVERGKTVPGLHVVGVGSVEVEGVGEASPGDLLFPAEVLGGGKAGAAARAGATGALVLFAPRSAAHELLMSVPPLIEILAG